MSKSKSYHSFFSFIYEVKLKSICIIAKDSEVAPNFLKVYINQENVDFSIAEGKGLEVVNT